MADTVIWNDDMTMNFLAHEYQAARITYPNCPADKGHHWVRIFIKGSTSNGPMSRNSGMRYATCSSEEAAKECLGKLTEELVRVGVIAKPEPESGNRFDRVELPEVTS